MQASNKNRNTQEKIYYYLIYGNQNSAFHLDKLDGSLYTNKPLDREEIGEYELVVIANNAPDFYLTLDVTLNETTNEVDDGCVTKVTVTVTDVNDNAPLFENDVYYAAASMDAEVNDAIVNVTAIDFDFGVNGSFTYYITASNLNKYGSTKSSGSIIPSPFNITEDGELTVATPLTEYNQHRFIIDVVARETAPPQRETLTNVHVSIIIVYS